MIAVAALLIVEIFRVVGNAAVNVLSLRAFLRSGTYGLQCLRNWCICSQK